MPDDIVLRPQGRVSEPSPDAAPPGSMLVAENVTIREEGVVRHLGNSTVISSGTGNTIWNISPQFDNGTAPGQLCYSGNANGTSTGVAMSGALGTEIQYTDVDGTATTVQYFDHGDGESMAPMYIARDNLYLSDQRGMYKLASTDASALDTVWDIQAGFFTFSASASIETWLLDDYWVNYVAVVVMEDSNGVIRRGAPSTRYNNNNISGATVAVGYNLSIPSDIAEHADFRGVEVYRTRSQSNSVGLPRNYFRVTEHVASDFTSSAGFYTLPFAVDDEVDDTELGAAMYANSNQGGAAAGNIAPPEHLHHASFRGHEFWGDVSEKEFFPEIASTQIGNSAHEHVLLGGSTTVGQPDMTGVTNLNGAEVGMLLLTSLRFPATAYITTIAGAGPYTVTMSENATSAGATPDTAVDTAYILWGDGETDRIGINGNKEQYSDPHTDILASGEAYNDVGSRYWFSYLLGSRHRPARQGAGQIWISSPESFDTDVDWADLNTSSGAPTTGGTEANKALHRARIYWSKFQEPEHTTLGNFQDVGNASGIGGGQIVGLGALREALIIVKTDGVFRLTGDRGNWRIDPLDTSIRMIGGRSVQVMDNQVYALSERGVVRITAQGVTDLTDGIVGDWFGEAGIGTHRAGDLREYTLENDGYTPPLLQAAVDTTNREYVLMAEGSRGGNNGGDAELLVFNAKTGSFTTWELFTDSFGIASIGYARGDYSGTAEQYPGIVFGRAVDEGDGELRLIQNQRGVSGSDFPVELRFRARTEADPTHVKLWTDAVWQMAPGGATRADVSCIFQASEEGSDETVAVTDDGGTRQIRCWIPRGAARSDELVAGISGDNVSVRGFRLTFRSSGRRAPVSND